MDKTEKKLDTQIPDAPTDLGVTPAQPEAKNIGTLTSDFNTATLDTLTDNVSPIRLSPDDLSEENLHEIVDQLLSTTYIPDEPNDGPSFSKDECYKGNLNRIKSMIKDGSMFGIKIDGKIVATAGYKLDGKTSNGRQHFELTKVATLNGYEGRHFMSKLFNEIKSHLLQENPEAIISTASRNEKVIEHLRKSGWQVLDFKDQEFHGFDIKAKPSNSDDDPRMRTEFKKMLRAGYKILVFDSKGQ